MSEPFIAEIRMFAGNFAPRGWAFCDGQTLPIAQNTALFSLIGITYGGDGQTVTNLPDLRGRAPMHPGRGPGLSARQLGQKGGATAVALTSSQIPNHTHTAMGAGDAAFDTIPSANTMLGATPSEMTYATGPPADMAPDTLAETGGGQPHKNMQPSLVLNFIIALVGLFPSRN